MELSFKHCLQLVCQQAEILGDTFYLEWSDGGSLRQDKSIEGQDRIVKRCIHDGTLSFTHDLIREALLLIWQKRYNLVQVSPEEGTVPHYTIGKIELNRITEYDKPEHMKWPTVCEEITIPVKVEWRNLLGGMPLLHGEAQY